MNFTAKKPRRFRERVTRAGWTGPASATQPVVGDRILTVRNLTMAVTFEPAERITRIEPQEGNVRYHLANGTTVLVAPGAHIRWEER